MERIFDCIVPEWAVSAIEYGDFDGLAVGESEAVQRFINDLPAGAMVTWGQDLGYCRENDVGGLPCNCVEAVIYGHVPRNASDPTRRELVRAILREFGSYRQDDQEGFRFDLESAIYWFAARWHSGQWSNLYSIMSMSEYRPGPCTRGPEPGTSEEYYYDFLVDHFCPKIEGGQE
jgi:hypothetical protein